MPALREKKAYLNESYVIKLSEMQRRRSERIPLNLPTKIKLGGKTYDGIIINVSEDGIGSSVTSVVEAQEEFIPAHNIQLHFQDHSGKTIALNGELMWFSRSRPTDQHLAIGMTIIDPPLTYMMFIKTLYGAGLMEKSKEQLIAELLEARRKIADLEANATMEKRGVAEL